MRKVSLRRQQLNREVSPARDELRTRVGRCEFCGRHNHGLQVHEILRGTGYRPKALDKPFCQLVLCADCHPLMDGRSWAEQLAILMRSRRSDFNLKLFWELASRKAPDAKQVLMWLKRLSFVPAEVTAREF